MYHTVILTSEPHALVLTATPIAPTENRLQEPHIARDDQRASSKCARDARIAWACTAAHRAQFAESFSAICGSQLEELESKSTIASSLEAVGTTMVAKAAIVRLS